MTTPTESQKLPQHEARLSTARAVAHWHIGSASWADLIVAAYCNPVAAREALKRDKGEEPSA